MFAFGMAFYGWWMASVAERGHHAEFFDWAITEIDSNNSGTAALVLIEDGRVVHRFFSDEVDENTLFATASFSKWITALAVMSLVEQGEVDLDMPVANYLTRWQLPDSEYDNDAVSIRRLLSHTAGLTDGLGFGDYLRNEPLPSLEQELSNPRASAGREVKITVGREPGAEFLGDQINASPSFNIDGSLAPTYQYASAAATAFASSVADLSNLVVTLLNGKRFPLQQDVVASMREPHGFMLGSGIWGLGTMLYVQTHNGDFVFGHDGANDPAINTSVRINPETLDGFVMLVSGHPSLASAIGSEWVLWQTGYPDFLSTERAL